MSEGNVVLVIRVSWLVLCGMMLFSRFVFQAAGPVWMRAFLETWKTSVTHRAWGWAAFLFGVGLAATVVGDWGAFNSLDRALAVGLVAILAADGLLNLFPAWFGHFKERMQSAWVKRNAGERASDAHLFGTVNFFLGLASTAVGALVYLYRPLEARWLLWSGVIAAVVMTVLILACRAEQRQVAEQAG